MATDEGEGEGSRNDEGCGVRSLGVHREEDSRKVLRVQQNRKSDKLSRNSDEVLGVRDVMFFHPSGSDGNTLVCSCVEQCALIACGHSPSLTYKSGENQ